VNTQSKYIYSIPWLVIFIKPKTYQPPRIYLCLLYIIKVLCLYSRDLNSIKKNNLRWSRNSPFFKEQENSRILSSEM
jgi:hypothetical protein